MSHNLLSKYYYFAAILFLVVIDMILTSSASLATAIYNPNDLIDNAIVTNTSTMNQNQIQSFLVGKGSYLANYSAISVDDNAREPAAKIIYEAANDYDINPQAILATMQKEQGLVTNPTPTTAELNCAMGYQSCGGYVGFGAQVDAGTWQFQHDYDAADGITPVSNFPCRNATSLYSNAILPGNTVTFYNPGGTAETVTIANAATATLYCYTPYVGPFSLTGYSGSYNFVISFDQWFGSSTNNPTITTGLTLSPSNPVIGEPITASFTITNNNASPIGVGGMIVAVRDPNGKNKDYALANNVVIPAHGTYTYSDSQTFTTPGQYQMFISNLGGGVWYQNYPASANSSISQQATVNIAK